jgi:hypothetical protein
MEPEPRRWNGAEAWIFLSIGDAGGTEQTTLDKVIGAADSNNHSIPNVDEFSLAVGQLVGAGLVVAAPNRYALTDSGRHLFEEINSMRRGHITRFVETAKAWELRAPSDADPVQWQVDADLFKHAYETYHEWFQATYKRLRDSDERSRKP